MTKYEIGDEVILHGSFQYNGKKGIIVAIDESYPYLGKTVQRLLIKGKGLGGAVLKEGDKKIIKEDCRYAYDFMVEKVK